MEWIAVVTGILTLVTMIVGYAFKRKSDKEKAHHAMDQVDDTVLHDSMDTVDKLYPDPPKS